MKYFWFEKMWSKQITERGFLKKFLGNNSNVTIFSKFMNIGRLHQHFDQVCGPQDLDAAAETQSNFYGRKHQ